MKSLEMVTSELSDRRYQLKPYCEDDKKELYEIYRQVILAGTNYPQEFGTMDEFEACFFTPGSSVYVCKSTDEDELVGGFNLKPNFPGRASHIANAAYMLRDTARGKGLGSLLVEASIMLARNAGYKAIQFNMVLSQNVAAVNLYKKIGFEIIGTIPQAIRNPDGQYQAGYIMYYPLHI